LERAPAAAKFVVFDACRTELQIPTKDASKGLLPVAEQRGMFIAYSTAPGRTALDTGANSGPYAAALSSELSKSGLDHLNLFQNVKEAVLAASGGAQQPWESNGLARRIYLTGQPASVAQVVEQNFWGIVKDSDNPSVLQTYLDRYPNGKFADLARASIELRQQERRVKHAQIEADERHADEERKAAEEKRLEEAQKVAALELAEARRSEAARRAKEKELADQLKQVSEEARLAKATARAAEERSKAALRDSENARAAAEATKRAQSAATIAEEQQNAAVKEAEEAKRALEAAQARQTAALAAPGNGKLKTEASEVERLRQALEALQAASKAAEAQKQAALEEAEEARKALEKVKAAQAPAGRQQLAALEPASNVQGAQPSELSRFAALGVEELAKEMQRELERVGCDPGNIDGKWGEKGKAALGRFIKYTKVSVTADTPSPEALDIIAAQRVRICPLECGDGEHAVGDKCVQKPKEAPRRTQPERKSTSSGAAAGYQTCGPNGCQWVPRGCTAIRHGGGGGLGGRIYCPGKQ
jgi:Caspase domain